MEIVRDRAAMQATASTWRARGLRIGCVPTMGALHAGHLALVAHARPGCDRVVASIFVNPLQFGPREDLAAYPRDLDGDAAKLRGAGCDLVFAPEAGSMYAPDASTFVTVEGLTDGLCGRSRPGHFRGVTTVVAKLFHLVQPHVAVFGQKDAQQAVVVARMVRDLDWPIELRVAPIVREADGLAMSSRNAYLSAAERAQAALLHAGLQAARERLARGERDAAALRGAVREALARGDAVRIEYVELVDAATLQPVPQAAGRVLLAVAATVGATRLIDNIVVDVCGEAVADAPLVA